MEFIMLNRMLPLPLALFAALTFVGIAMVPARAANPKEDYVAFCAGAKDDGPDADCVHALKIGAGNARRVLVLVPGGSEGAESLRAVGRNISNALPNTQVWAFDRRQQNL